MKDRFKDAIDLRVHTNHDPAAKGLSIGKAPVVFADGDAVPLKIAVSEEKMEAYLKDRLEATTTK